MRGRNSSISYDREPSSCQRSIQAPICGALLSRQQPAAEPRTSAIICHVAYFRSVLCTVLTKCPAHPPQIIDVGAPWKTCAQFVAAMGRSWFPDDRVPAPYIDGRASPSSPLRNPIRPKSGRCRWTQPTRRRVIVKSAFAPGHVSDDRFRLAMASQVDHRRSSVPPDGINEQDTCARRDLSTKSPRWCARQGCESFRR